MLWKTMVQRAFILVILIAVSACAAPTLKQRDISQSQIDEEARIQKKLAEEDLYKQLQRLKKIALKISPQVRQLCSYFSEGKMGGCYFPVEVVDSSEINAYTDGEKVVFNKGIMKFLETDEEIAVVLGHEYAHAMLRHINKRKSNFFLGLIVDVLITGATGVDTQATFADAASRAYSKDFELEADYAGLYLAHRAGYDISKAANVWRKMGIENQSSIVERYNSTHPSSPKRFIAQDKTYEEILNKEIDGQPLLPDKLQPIEKDEELKEYEPSLAQDEYKATTKRPIKVENEINLGQDSYQAKKVVRNLECSEPLETNGVVDEVYGKETHEFYCGDQQLLVECEFGNCTLIN